MPSERQPTPEDSMTVSVSGAFTELSEYGAVLFRVIQKQGLSYVTMASVNLRPAMDYRSLVSASAAYVGLLEHKYGHIPGDPALNPGRLSGTELEFNEAMRLNRPVLLFIREGNRASEADFDTDSEKRKKLEAFRVRATQLKSDSSVERFYVAFDGLDDFQEKADAAIARLHSHLIDRVQSFSQHQQDLDPTPTQIKSEGPPPLKKKSVRIKPPVPVTRGTTKPLVFISASHKDSEWRQLIEQTLENYNKDIEWWDDSKLEPGIPWEAEIEAAIARTLIAVVLLSPDYLDSRNAIVELVHLRAQSKSGRLTLFPIVVRDCAWKDIREIRDVQVWAQGRALEHLPDHELLTDELGKIAGSILKLVGKTPSPSQGLPGEQLADDAPSSPELHLSKNTKMVLDEARSLATKSGRGRITSSCLLFGFAESAGSENNCARFVRDMLESTGQYATAFQTFLADSDKHQDDMVTVSIGMTSRNIASVLEYARKIAVRVSLGSDTIHLRHLLAALLNLPGRKGKLKAHQRLKEMGIERSQSLGDLLEFIRKSALNDNFAEWTIILAIGPKPKATREPTPSPFLEGPAGYTAEFCGVGGERPVADHLFVGTHADRLAELIALRETKLPLAIGLFGNWGSGKSHFMNLMDRRLKALMAEEKKNADRTTAKWCREIVPIYFNAWHYLDANLWASLVAQIFESLFAHLRPKKNDLAEVQKLLEEASGATARAAEEVTIAQAATVQARVELRAAEDSRRREQTVVEGLLHGLESLLPEVRPEVLREQVIDVLDVRKEVKTIDDLRDVVHEANSLVGFVRRLWKEMWRRPGRGWRIGWLTTAVVIVPILSTVAVMYLPVVRDWIHGAGRYVAGLLTVLPALALWVRPILAQANRKLNHIEGWAKQAEIAQQRARETPKVREASMNVTAATAREEAAKSRLAEAETREKQLTEEARNLAPERRLSRYIEQRAQSSDYRGQLGLVSLARRDFQELSNLFADAEALREKVTKLRTSKVPDEEARAKQQAQAEQIEKLSRSIDRIVLFVDDLDRCQPEKVVEILQAVHLLLAFPLFAVVVGVDQRCLRQSLRMQFKGLLTPDRGRENGKAETDKSNTSTRDDERLATPLDYLEKIFHVPFHLPAMEEEGFGELIHQLTEPPKLLSSSETEQRADVRLPSPSGKIAGEGMAAVPKQVAGDNAKAPEAETPDNPPPAAPSASIQAPPMLAEMIGSVPLQDWERKALRDYYPLIQTPRGATRLLNTYRLVRAGIPKEEWHVFSSRGEFRVAMLLLAAAAGYPAVAREWFAELRKGEPRTLLSGKTAWGTDPAAWNQFKRVHKATFTKLVMPLTKTIVVKWLDRVERFTF